VAAVRGHAIDRDARAAELRPAEAAMSAAAAAGVVMIHHPLAVGRFALGNAGAARDHDAAGLVASDKGFGQIS
jgi:hypothetical protein